MLFHTARKVPAPSGPSNAHSRGMRAAEPQQSCRVTLGGLRLFDIAMLASSGARFAERDLWNIQSGNPDQLILAPANLITFAHFSVYSAMNVANSAGELANTVPPRSAIRAFMRGSARPALISLLSLSMISAGVFLGAPTPCQPVPS